MAEFAYTTVPGKIVPLLDKIREVGIPARVSIQWLSTIGFTSSNDKTLIGVLKLAGLIDASSVPTSVWTQYRGSDYKKVLGKAIRAGYAELFAVYNDAPLRPITELEHVFSTSSTAGKQVVGKTVSTFKALADAAEFDGLPTDTSLNTQEVPLHAPVTSAPKTVPPSNGALTPSLHIDIQIHIAPEASTEQIDQIFKSMSKHLYGSREAL